MWTRRSRAFQRRRKLGRGGLRAFFTSTLGKVVFAGAESIPDTVRALASAYALNAKPARVSLVSEEPGRIIVRLENVYYFPDSHHVGTFEGAVRHAGARGRVRIDPRSPSDADFEIAWTPTPS